MKRCMVRFGPRREIRVTTDVIVNVSTHFCGPRGVLGSITIERHDHEHAYQCTKARGVAAVVRRGTVNTGSAHVRTTSSTPYGDRIRRFHQGIIRSKLSLINDRPGCCREVLDPALRDQQPGVLAADRTRDDCSSRCNGI